MDRVRAKKHLGQHFLREQYIANDIAGALQLTKTQNILEIGPGMGVLTRPLLSLNADQFKVVELDHDSVAYLEENFPQLQGAILEENFLKMDLENAFSGVPFAIIGNFPYNISSQILFRVFENHELVPEVVGMFQREVAQRIASPEGNKSYGILSVLLQVYYKIDYLFTLEATAFDPPPKVKSGVIRLERNDRKVLPVSDKFFKSVVKMAFNQRRKTLKNSISSLLKGEIPKGMGQTLKLRPEQMSPDAFIELAKAVDRMNT